MTFKYIVIPDPESTMIDSSNLFLIDNEKDIQKTVNLCASKSLGKNIVVYEIKNLHKLINSPQFAKYEYTKNGEVLPC